MEQVTRRSFVAGAAALAAGTMAAGAARADEAVEETAAEEAAPAASANPAWLGDEPEDGEIVNTLETEVLIIGAGNGGMAAAATASDLGVDFLVAEQFDTPQDTRHWIGAVNSIHTEETGESVNVTRLQYELARYASYKCDQKVHKMWINESAEMIEWLDTIMEPAGLVCAVDAEMGPEIDPTCETGNYIPPQQHMYGPAEGSEATDDRNNILLQYVTDAGNGDKFLWNHTLVKLVHADGKVNGAIFETDEGNVQVNATYTVLATGGYPSNPEMVKALAPIVPECVTAVSYSPKDRGQGIKAGLWAGAKMDTESAPMIFNRGLVDNGVPCGYDDNDAFRGTVGQFNLGSQPFMKVCQDGTRFCNESCPYDFTCFAASLHKDGLWAMVFDANAAEDVARFATAGCSKGSQSTLAATPDPDEAYASQIEAGLIKRADTVEELADALGFAGEAKDAFLAEVEKYNGFFDAQEDADFGKEAYRLSALRTAPFYGGWFGGSLLTTCDGLRINSEMQVLTPAAEPIEGLYAIGDCSGSYFANNYPEYLISAALGRTLTQGRHVVRRIAGDIQ